MLNEERTDVSGLTVEELLAEYEAALAEIIDAVGEAAAAEQSGVEREIVAALAAGESPTIDLEAAAALFALEEGVPDADSIHVEATEHLLLGMSMAVMDVDALAADAEIDAGPKAIQQKLERRAPMTLAEFAALEHCIASGR